MTSNTSTEIVSRRRNPRTYAPDREMPTYDGSPLDVATSLPQLNKKAQSLLKLVQDAGTSTVQNTFIIPLRALCNFFDIGLLPPECTYTIEFGINQNNLELFDHFGVAAETKSDLGQIRFVETPELHFNLVEQTPSNQIAFEQIFNKFQSYRLLNGWSWNQRKKEVAKGLTEVEVVYSPDMLQYKWLKISLENLDSYKLPNIFCNYDNNIIMQKLKKIKITGLLSNNSNSIISYDLTDRTDVDKLFHQYLARLYGFGNSRAPSDDTRIRDT